MCSFFVVALRKCLTKCLKEGGKVGLGSQFEGTVHGGREGSGEEPEAAGCSRQR